MRISELLDEKTLLIPFEAASKEEAIEALVDRLAAAGRIPDRDAALEAVLARERALSTGVGGGIAVPHATLAGLKGPALALGRLEEGIEFDSVDGQGVRLIFL
ncbi:MAG TPA: PTS fructose transporter subunit IIA, partial [Bacteroidetes bacterium]|nr:PTS fructose transporter subunit IIA [Bacteroidota bacterium]